MYTPPAAASPTTARPAAQSAQRKTDPKARWEAAKKAAEAKDKDGID